MFLFLISCRFNNFFTSPAHNENVKTRLALAIPTCTAITVANDVVEMLPLVTDKMTKIYQKNQKRKYIY